MHEKWMKQALLLAREAAEAGEVPVGCVIVRDGVAVGRGRNRREEKQSALSHAEIEAIRQANAALGSWRLDGCALYVTLEPCPMCAGAILNARIPRVYYGARDAVMGSCGGVLNLFMEDFPHPPALVGGILEQECRTLLADFFRGLRGQAANPRHSIEPLALEDYEKCANIWNMRDSPYTEVFRREIEAGNRTVYVYKIDGVFIAECALVREKDDPDYTRPGLRIYLSRLIVKKSYRRQGIGGRLLDFVLRQAEEMGYREVSAGVDKDNEAALCLYRKYGFSEVLFEGADEAGEYYKLLKSF